MAIKLGSGVATVRLGSNLANRVYLGSNEIWSDAGGSDVYASLAEYAAQSASTSHTITFDQPSTPGTTIVVIYDSPAVVTIPSGWSRTQFKLDMTDFGALILPAASHTTPLTSLTIDIAASRMITAFAFEDTITNDTLSYIGIVGTAGIVNSVWTSPSTTPLTDVAMAIFSTSSGVNANAITASIQNYSAGFTSVAELKTAGNVATAEPMATWVARGSGALDGSVVATFDGPPQGTARNDSLVIGYDGGVVPVGSGGFAELAQYSSTTVDSLHTINFSQQTTPGQTVVALVSSGAVITAPAGWTKAQLALGNVEISKLVLPAANHTTPLGSVSFTISGGQTLAAYIFEDEIVNDAVSLLGIDDSWAGFGGAPDTTTFSTPARNMIADKILAGFVLAGEPGFGDITSDVTSYDQGFVEQADVKGSPVPPTGGGNGMPSRMWIASKDDVNAFSQAVTATYDISILSARAWSFTFSYNNTGGLSVYESLYNGMPLANTANYDNTFPISVGTIVRPRGNGTIHGIYGYDNFSSGTNPMAPRIYDALNNTLLASGPAVNFNTGNGWTYMPLTTPYNVTAGNLYTIAMYSSGNLYSYIDDANNPNYLPAGSSNGYLVSDYMRGVFALGADSAPNSVPANYVSYLLDANFELTSYPPNLDEHTVFLVAPNGTRHYGENNITIANSFYRTGTETDGWRVVGGRFYLPTILDTQRTLIFKLWSTPYNTTVDLINDTPVRTVSYQPTLWINWQEIYWDTPYTPDLGVNEVMWVSVLVENDSYYTYNDGLGNTVQSWDGSSIYMSENARSAFSANGGATVGTSAWYGLDIIFDEGP